jgi:malonyl-CoA/methylmalonyl-CoA synthetase
MTSPSSASVDAWQRHAGRCLDAEQLIRQLTEGDLPGALHATARHDPQRPALLFPDENTGWISHGELDGRAARLGGWLIGQGLRPGERVLLCAENSLACVVSYLAALRAGAVVVLANPAYTASELRHLVMDSGARLALAGGPAVVALRPLVARLLPIDEELPEAEPAPLKPVDPDEVALLAYTSGTTGEPKGVPLTHANLLSSIRAAMLAWRWQPTDVLLHGLPLSHQHGLGGVHATLLAGSRAVILRRFDAEQLVHGSVGHGATVLFAVPAMYERLAAVPAHLQGLRELRLAICGSAPLSPELAETVRARLDQLPLERYGTTESGLNVSNPYDGPRRPGTVGLALPGVELRIADDGEVLLRGPQVFAGYWNRPEATAEAFHEKGWFRTGDIGQIDPATGYLTITGRRKELIITGGLNVYPREVELALERHPAVGQAAVAGLASPRWGEQVTAWVVAVPGSAPTEAELIAHARQQLAAYKCPKQLFVVAALPRNAMGKLMRRELTPPAAERREVAP